MDMSIFVERYLGRTQAVEGMVENWKIKHDQAMFVMDLDEMVRECLDLNALCQHVWKTLWQLLRRDPNGEAVDEAEEPIKTALAKTQHIFQSVQDLVAQAREKGYTIQNAEALPIATEEVRAISAKIGVVYPQINEELAEEAIAAFKRGECIPIEELIREAQSGNFPAN
jgi:hypothetical protein